MAVNLLLGALTAAAAALAPPLPGWQVMNGTNLRHGDAPGLDFSLPAGTTQPDAISACTAFCANHTRCAAWVWVRSGDRCAIKGRSENWCGPVADAGCVSGIKPGFKVQKCSGRDRPPSPAPTAGGWRLPVIDWAAGGIVGPASTPTAPYAVRAFDVVEWPADGKFYLYCDLVLFSNPKCPSSFGSEIGVFSAPSLDSGWTYHGIAVHKNASEADAGGLATPTAIVHEGRVFIYFAYEGLPVGAGLRGIGGAYATHPLGPFQRIPNDDVALAPVGWHRPTGPGGILDDPEVIFHGGRFHLFHSRKHLQNGDYNCSLTPHDPTASAYLSHCVEWRTSTDGMKWKRMGVLDAPGMSETMSARVYNDTLVMMTDGGGMVAFTTHASGLSSGTDAKALGTFTAGKAVNGYSGLNGSFVNVALRILPIDGTPTHVGLGWRPPKAPDDDSSSAAIQVQRAQAPAEGKCGPGSGMTFAIFPLKP